ncbi:hypothetical protein INR49_000834 [Caranx melampygus]|nr:hypothetical protein INR49_000834 [Caranx melampygus]
MSKGLRPTPERLADLRLHGGTTSSRVGAQGVSVGPVRERQLLEWSSHVALLNVQIKKTQTLNVHVLHCRPKAGENSTRQRNEPGSSIVMVVGLRQDLLLHRVLR